MNKPIDISQVEIRTERLLLRLWRETDLEDLYEYAQVDGVGQMAGWLPHKSMEESQTILNRFMEGKKVLAIEFGGKVIGSLGIERYREKEFPELDTLRGRELGYVLSKAYWGRGLMPEAVKAVIGWLFAQAGLDFVIISHFDWNSQSARVIEKCGLKYIKTTVTDTRLGTSETTRNYIIYRRD